MHSQKYPDNKIGFIFLGICLAILIIIIRLFYLQIFLNQKLYRASQRNFSRISNINSARGNIVDTNGHILVTNRPVINIYWQGTGNKSLSKEQLEQINYLSQIIEQNIVEQPEFIKIKSAEKFSRSFLIISDIAYEKLSQIAEKFADSKNIFISTKFKRYYPQKSMACHIIGYLAQIDDETIGKMGLEKIFEDDLKGQSGTQISTINSVGKSIQTEKTKNAVPGKTIKTTLDFHLQKIAEEIFPKNLNGAMILMDPESGALKTILSRPNFDPTVFLKQLSLKEWTDIQATQPFLNRAFNACYPPASIFKLVSLSAALELGIVKPDSTWFCSGYINFRDRRYHCAKARLHGHGVITPREAIIKSCNTFFYNIAKQIYIDDLAHYANRFGLGQKTGMIFAEKSGLIPTNSWKKRMYKQKWWAGETLSAIIGQSYLLVSPIQIAKMISSIFQGYLVNPRILEDEPIIKTPLKIRRDILELLKQSMKTVVTSGTSQRIGKLKDITIYAKTGTAQNVTLDKENLDGKYLDHAWFISNFAYKNNKSLTMVIFLENAGSTAIAINAAREFILKYKELFEEN